MHRPPYEVLFLCTGNSARMLAFRMGFQALERRIRLFTSLPMEGLDRMVLTRRMHEIGRVRPDAAEGIAS